MIHSRSASAIVCRLIPAGLQRLDRARRRMGVGLALLIFGLLPQAVQGAPIELPQVPENIRQLMQDRDYAKAVEAIDGVLAKDLEDPDYLLYLKGRALLFQDKHDEAIAVFDQIIADHDDSPWLRRVRFTKGVALARKGDFRAAEQVYRKEATFLLSAERKEEIAEIYLEFARNYFDPPSEEVEPRYDKALPFFQRALEVAPDLKTRPQVELRIAQSYQRLGNHGEAINHYRRFIERYASKPDAAASDALVVEARYLLGESLLATNNHDEARRTWQDLLALHPDSESDLLPKAAFKIGSTWQLPQPQSLEQLDLGVAALKRFIEEYPAHELADDAWLNIARSYMHLGQHAAAVENLKPFLADERYEGRTSIPDARTLLGHALQQQRKFDEALAVWREYLKQHPTHESWSEVQRVIIDTEFYKAQAEFERKDYDAARELWNEFLAKYPLDSRAARIQFLFGQIHFVQKQWDEAIQQWRRVVSKYPASQEASHAQFMIARTLEQQLGKLEEALKEYRKLDWGNYASQATQSASRLTSKAMRVETTRVFRSDETPRIKVTTRNIERLTVNLYKIDLETYFRKMHLARNVEQLDISLIDPDRTLEFEVPDYEAYALHENWIETPIIALEKGGDGEEAEGDEAKEAAEPVEGGPEGGVWIATVSSKTLEATTLVLQSDLDIIAKSSRHEVFVFAQNMRTGQPWPGARLLISNGDQVFAEAETGDDGVWQASYDELEKSGDIRVFAISGPHVASNRVSLENLGVAQGLENRGYIYTDRPAYRPGQLVNVRGIIRNVSGDQFSVPESAEFEVEVYDPRDRLIARKTVTLNEFGTFHARYLLPESSFQGTYRIHVHDRDKQAYQGSFEVQSYQLEPVLLSIETERSVYYRGETIKGTIEAKYYYGAPLVNRVVRYHLQGEPVQTARTDEEGRIQFEFPTRKYRESQGLAMIASLPERNLNVGRNFYLTTQGFTLDFDLKREVYLAGETFEVTVSAHDGEGEPIEQPLTLTVLRQTVVDGRVGEVEVSSHELTTSADSGKARVTLKLDEGGEHVLRVTGTDRFDNPVSAENPLTISDDNDRTRLRILAERHSLKVGEQAQVKVHWREAPTLALVTYQAARILRYQLVDLKKGNNQLAIDVGADLAPNFQLDISVMVDPRHAPDAKKADEEAPALRLHTATSYFDVERKLLVSMTVAAPEGEGRPGELRPGQEVAVTVKTTDPTGKPVAAEVSLAMVEQALLERFPSPLGGIESYFSGNYREAAVETTSSIDFSYHPTTRPINTALLAEADRLELERTITAELEVLEESFDMEIADGSLPAPGGGPLSGPGGPFGGMAFDDLRQINNDPFADPGAPGEQSAGGMMGGMLSGGGGAFGFGGAGQSAGQDGQQMAMFESNLSLQIANSPQAEGQTASISDVDRLQRQLQSRAALIDWDGDGNANASAEWGQSVWMVKSNGVVENMKFDVQFQNKTANEQARWIAEQMAPSDLILPTGMPQETGYWNPSVQTNADGVATVTFTLPEQSTTWQFLVKGVTTDTLAGEATDELQVKKLLFGQLKAPASFTDGDQATLEATVHNQRDGEGTVPVALTIQLGDKQTRIDKQVKVNGKGIYQLEFPIEIELPEGVTDQTILDLKFEVGNGELVDTVVRRIPVAPYGLSIYSVDGGAAESDALVTIGPPEGMQLEAPQLQVVVGPTIERSLLDVVLGSNAFGCDVRNLRLSSATETTVSDLMASLALQRLMGSSREADSPQRAALDQRVTSAISSLVALQTDDGGWSWASRTGSSDRYVSARVVWGLSEARQAGYSVPDSTWDPAIAYLKNQLGQTRVADYETKAVLLHALATAGHGDFPLANQLYRNRPALLTGGLTHLALALIEMDRHQTAAELLSLMAERNLAEPKSRGQLASQQSETDLRALYAVALAELEPRMGPANNGRLAEQVDWLMANRNGRRWAPDRATGPAMVAICRWFAQRQHENQDYKLRIFVNDLLAKELELDGESPTQSFQVPDQFLKEAGQKAQRVRFEIVGRGRYTYQCVLNGFVPADKVAATTQDWKVWRYYEPAQLERDGYIIPRGFDILTGNYSTFRNPLTQLPVAKRAHVELRVQRYNIPSNTPQEELEYLVISEPLPAGTSVVEDSVQGGFEHYELSPGAITFYVGTSQHVNPIRFELHGYVPGDYHASPTVVRNAYRLDQIAVASAFDLKVIPQGRESTDEYRLTPRELFELGQRAYSDKQYQAAAEHLGKLLADWNLNPDYFKQSVEMLLHTHLQIGPATDVVRYFEIIIEKYPELAIAFDDYLKIGDAYHQLGEYERSYLVFRAIVERNFQRESLVAKALADEAEFLRSISVMHRLIREYPPEAYIASATYALTQQIYSKAPEAATDQKLREAGVTSVTLIHQAAEMLDLFLTSYPNDPAADQAAFSLANAYLDLKLYERAIQRCQNYAERYSESDFLDSYWYIIGYCHFARGEHKLALEMCEKVAEATRVDRGSGRTVESPNKWRAIYILGQIYHSLGRAEAAIREYSRVDERFADARQAIEYFARKEIQLPEVEAFRPGEDVQVELQFRNIVSCDATVYRIDLMKFSLLRRDLSNITNINLAGIRPLYQETIPLGDGKDYRDRTKSLDLPLQDEGAYLVVCRGEDLHTSGMIVISPLELEVQEEADSGRVRTTVRNRTNDAFKRDVHVKVIGTDNADFASGETDLRGVFVADGIRGKSMVIAQADQGSYAFYRGDQYLGPRPQPNAPAQQAGENDEAPGKPDAADLLEGLKGGNRSLQMEQQKEMNKLYDEGSKNSSGFGGGGVF